MCVCDGHGWMVGWSGGLPVGECGFGESLISTGERNHCDTAIAGDEHFVYA